MVRKLKKKSVGSGALSRSEIVSVRLEPKQKYLAEIAARMQRRTLSSFIESAVENALGNIFLSPIETDHENRVGINKLWAIHEAERFLRLAIIYPDLLTFDEQEILQILFDSFFLHQAHERGPNGELIWDWAELERSVFPALREEWPQLMMACVDKNRQDIDRWIDDMRQEVMTRQEIAKGNSHG